jgi:methionyl aminopeptidase
MIFLKNAEEIQKMKKAGKITADALAIAGQNVRPGITTKRLDTIIRREIEAQGATPSFLNYGGFPASACISVNDVVIHGIPSDDCILKDGDIVSIDVGACFDGFHGDSSWTFPCGNVSKAAQELMDATRESLFKGIKMALIGNRIGDIAAEIQEYIEAKGYGVVRDFVGHGVGRHLHEDPAVPNFGHRGHGLRLQRGMVIAIEPMVNAGGYEVDAQEDGSVTTSDSSLSAHFEHTIVITDEGPFILTQS